MVLCDPWSKFSDPFSTSSMLKTGNGWTKLLRTLSHDEERITSTDRFKSQTFREPNVTFIALYWDEVNGAICGTKPLRPLSLPHNLPSLCSRKGHLLLRALQWFQCKIKDIARHLGLIETVSISEGLELPMQLIARDIFQLANARTKSKRISRCPPPRPSLDLLAPLAICFYSCLVVRQVAKKPSAQEDENRSGSLIIGNVATFSLS